MTPVRLEPVAPRSRVKRSTTEPLRSLIHVVVVALISCHKNVAKIFLALALCPFERISQKRTLTAAQVSLYTGVWKYHA